MPTICEPFRASRAETTFENGRVVLFAAGTGNPFFTTDTAAALRAVEMGCDALLKGTERRRHLLGRSQDATRGAGVSIG